MVVHRIKRAHHFWRAYCLKLVTFSAVLVISSAIAGNFHGNPSYAQIEPLNPGGIICPSEVTMFDGSEAIGTVPISNGSLSLIVGDLARYDMTPDPDGLTQSFFSLLEITTVPTLNPRNSQKP